MVSRKNLPKVTIDELIPEDAAADNIKILTRIASNNVEAGRLQAQLLLKSLSQGAKVAIIEATQERPAAGIG
jgi:ABC-type sugar transport system substrate-binding protein